MPAYRTLVAASGAVTVQDSVVNALSVPPTVVGSSPQWADGSDATYAELETFEHPDASSADAGLSTLPAVPSLNLNPDAPVLALVRYRSLSADMAPPRVLARNGGTTIAEGTGTGSGSTAITDVAIPLTPVGGFTLENLEFYLQNGNITLWVTGPFLRVYTSRYVRTRIYEAALVVERVLGAPPCRNTGRDDWLGVGGARNRGSRSQQSGVRNTGYY